MDQLRHVTTILMASDVPIDPIIGWGTLAVGFQRLRRIGRHQDRYSEIVLCLKCGPEIGLFPPYPPWPFNRGMKESDEIPLVQMGVAHFR